MLPSAFAGALGLVHASFFQYFDDPPVLVLADRPSFDHTHTISDAAGILLVMGLELRHAPEHLMIDGVHDLTLNRHDDRLIHLVVYHPPDPFSPLDYTLSHALQPFRR
jgi:hypothetical protein